MDFKDYDIVIVSTHAWGNWVRARNAKKIVYCHTPVRYFWDLYEDYYRNKYVPFLGRVALKLFRPIIQKQDTAGAKTADIFFANSCEVQNRIERSYARKAQVLYPPVNVSYFSSQSNEVIRKDYYLVVSRLKPYKRIDLIVNAFNELNLPLRIVGEGPQSSSLQKNANQNIQFVGAVSDKKLKELYVEAKGYVYMAHEDFGMTLVEAQASGTPVIAHRLGGASETVIEGVTGVLFDDQTVASLIGAIEKFKGIVFDRIKIQENAQKFAKTSFVESFQLELLKL